MPTKELHPVVRDWFAGHFGSATEAQERAWPAIRSGEHVLISAPTGSGKTLAAFLICLDDLVRAGLETTLPETTQVLYVSPLKALSNDIHKNLDVPLSGMSALAGDRGLLMPPIRTAVRTGDTPTPERQRMIKHPPHILVTTPESLFILLTSERSRQALGSVRTVNVDEWLWDGGAGGTPAGGISVVDAEEAALRAQGEAGDIPVPERRSVTGGHVRPEARAGQISRAGNAGGLPKGEAGTGHADAVAVPLQTLWAERAGNQRSIRENGGGACG